jgi:hypothetical protein
MSITEAQHRARAGKSWISEPGRPLIALDPLAHRAHDRGFGTAINHRLKPLLSPVPWIAALLTRRSVTPANGQQRTRSQPPVKSYFPATVTALL